MPDPKPVSANLFSISCHYRQRAENALKFYRGAARDKAGMNGKVKLEYENMQCWIKMANCDITKGKITLGDFRKNC